MPCAPPGQVSRPLLEMDQITELRSSSFPFFPEVQVLVWLECRASNFTVCYLCITTGVEGSILLVMCPVDREKCKINPLEYFYHELHRLSKCD